MRTGAPPGQVVVATWFALLLAACSPDPGSPSIGTAQPGTASVSPGVPPQQTRAFEKADAAAKALLARSLPDAEGKPQALSQWKGKVLVINYWATWCPPCREEMPYFSRLHQELAVNGVQFIGIAIDSAAKVKKFSQETPVSYPLLIGSLDSMQSLEDLGNAAQGLPFTVILDREGQVQATKLGRYSEQALEKRLRELAGQ